MKDLLHSGRVSTLLKVTLFMFSRVVVQSGPQKQKTTKKRQGTGQDNAKKRQSTGEEEQKRQGTGKGKARERQGQGKEKARKRQGQVRDMQ